MLNILSGFFLDVLSGAFLLIGTPIRLLGESLVRVHDSLENLIDKRNGY